MIVLRELRVKIGKKYQKIDFGIPSTEKELESVFRFRFDVYNQKGYIDPNKFRDGIEKDSYDDEGKCTYFIAKIDEKIIGSIRLIRDNPLPTEKIFQFETPEKIKSVPTEKRGELGRFIIVPPDRENHIYLPRNLVLLCMLDILVKYGVENDIQGGYSFIKKSLELKLRKIKLPIHAVKKYSFDQTKTGTLKNYFSQKEDTVAPFYFLTSEINSFINKILNNKKLFEREGDKKITLRHTLYTRFLQTLKII